MLTLTVPDHGAVFGLWSTNSLIKNAFWRDMILRSDMNLGLRIRWKPGSLLGSLLQNSLINWKVSKKRKLGYWGCSILENMTFQKGYFSRGKVQQRQKLTLTIPKRSHPTHQSGKRRYLWTSDEHNLLPTQGNPTRTKAFSCPHISPSPQGNSSSWFAHGLPKMNCRMSNKEVVKVGTMTRQTFCSQESYRFYFWVLWKCTLVMEAFKRTKNPMI